MAKKLKPEDYYNHPDVTGSLKKLQEKFGANYNSLIVSDTLDDDGHQYVNLVQKGGGVLGIALVGYTYILEMAGIRFLRLAGTSAGAINTALMTVIGDKKAMKSNTILDYLCSMDFFSFVDGHPFARWLIKNFISNKSFKTTMMVGFGGIFGFLVLISILDILFLGFGNKYPCLAGFGLWSFVLTGADLLLVLLIVSYAVYLFDRLKACGFGINPGITFYEWIKEKMEANDVHNVTDLKQKAETLPPLHLRPSNSGTVDSLTGDVTFITSELVTENKIELPLMCDLFREDINEIHPAAFVRSSMSIPVFFESYIINQIPVNSKAVQDAWNTHLKIPAESIPETVRFVDGGMLSNFPINIFYNPKVIEPRLPAFGIDLDDADPKKNDGNNAAQWDLGSYIWRLFNTVRYYYDKDFLEKNAVFQKGVGSIKLFGINWLNFFLKDDEKLEMFRKGALAATAFLIDFDWPEYQKERIAMQVKLNDKMKPEN
ncbi:patatin-like phospholipase family protein [Mucilaginibacter flavus]|uniref:patatin-like phospholipase family protein n=1 Tax=Mucilaginibacter flavus TaxID=931504 RepID=UPI0025B57C0F|nr:patatin-like phospholipase family protein [Mucilaginibacter flavus]MDN3579226.1 patatin-like phospholipase family protein [Mucilaginibacter flavus]